MPVAQAVAGPVLASRLTSEALIDPSGRDLGEPELSEGPDLEIDVVLGGRDGERGEHVAGGLHRVADPLGARELQPSAIGSRRALPSRRSARPIQPPAVAALPQTSAYSRDSHRAIRVARASSPRRRKPA